jgi:NADH-quinone oxidoreductase subunit E
VARLSDANLVTAREIIARYPRPKSALIPLLHLAQASRSSSVDLAHDGVHR